MACGARENYRPDLPGFQNLAGLCNWQESGNLVALEAKYSKKRKNGGSNLKKEWGVKS